MKSQESSYPRLLADVGGTHVRFASQLIPDGPLQSGGRYACADFETLWDAICHHLWREGLAPPRAGAIGIATAVTGDHVRMTNHHWSFSIRSLKQALSLDRLLVLNDFSALAMALPHLPAGACRQVGGERPVPHAPMALIGPCTGLGVSGLMPVMGGAGVAPIGGEGGHVTLSATTPEETAVLQILQARFGGHASAERALSGPGLENLYQALAQVHGTPVAVRSSLDISKAGLAGTDLLAERSLQMFCALLGDVAGNLALTLGARGGVYIAGGLVPQLGEWFDRSAFRQRFEAKGRLRGYLCDIPCYVLKDGEQVALLGAARVLDLGRGH